MQKQKVRFHRAISWTSQGYHPYEVQIDKEIAESISCPVCGQPMQYEGWKNKESYIALGVCPRCGTEVAF